MDVVMGARDSEGEQVGGFRSCLLHVGADTPSALVWMITSVDAGFTLTGGPPELAAALRAQAARCLGAVDHI